MVKQGYKCAGVTIAHKDLVAKSYEEIRKKGKAVLSAWYNRGLSLMGKVQVVNTLVASLFVYKMMVLPEIPKVVVQNVDNIIREFLWNGKKAKIAYKILQNPKPQGILNLVDLTRRDKALKASWPTILAQEEEYAQLVLSQIGCKPLGHNLWRCHISPEDVARLNITNDSWKDVLKAWASFNYYKDFRIENQLLWYNSQIKVGNKVIYWKKIQEKGLIICSPTF